MLSIGNGPPLKDVKVEFSNGAYDHPWINGWKSYDLILPYIIHSKTSKVVVISAMWDALINGDFKNKTIATRVGFVKLFTKDGVEYRNSDLVLKGLEKTIKLLLEANKKNTSY